MIYFITPKSCFIEILWHYGNRRPCCYKRKLHIWLLKDEKCTFRSFPGIQNVFMAFESSQANKGTLIIPWLLKIWHQIESVLNWYDLFSGFQSLLHYLHDTKRKQSIQALLIKLQNNVGRQLPPHYLNLKILWPHVILVLIIYRDTNLWNHFNSC